MIMNLMGESDESFRAMGELGMRKFRQLKIVVLWLQQEQKFGRYCYYGCYCLPEGSHDIAQGGYGKPQDNIDRSCKDFKQCYRCLNEEFGDTSKGCAGEEFGYRFDLLTNDDGTKDVQCTNRIGSCRRSICECDLQLAKALAKYESEWDESLHSVKVDLTEKVPAKLSEEAETQSSSAAVTRPPSPSTNLDEQTSAATAQKPSRLANAKHQHLTLLAIL